MFELTSERLKIQQEIQKYKRSPARPRVLKPIEIKRNDPRVAVELLYSQQ